MKYCQIQSSIGHQACLIFNFMQAAQQISPWGDQAEEGNQEGKRSKLAPLRDRKTLPSIAHHPGTKQVSLEAIDFEGPVHMGSPFRMTRYNSIAELEWRANPEQADPSYYPTNSSSAQMKAATSLLAHRYFSRHEGGQSRVTRTENFVNNTQTARMKTRLEALLKQHPKHDKGYPSLEQRQSAALPSHSLKAKTMKQNNIEFKYKKVNSQKKIPKKVISNHILDKLLDCW